MYQTILQRLSASPFRHKFHLAEKDKAYVLAKGYDTIKRHAQDFISKRIASANLPNDGKQTPMRGHPVFIAQHATACCCRQCIYKWHHFSPAGELSSQQQDYLVGLIMVWIEEQMQQTKNPG